MSKSKLVIDTPNTCGDCPFCIHTKEEKQYIGYCHTSDEDFYCKLLDRFMEYDIVEGGVDILGKPDDCPLQEEMTGSGKNDNDVISRQAVHDAVYRSSGLAGAMRAIDNLPSVKPHDSKTGHWIAVDHQRLIHRCSECGTEGYVNTCNQIPTWKYCPICGAYMSESVE